MQPLISKKTRKCCWTSKLKNYIWVRSRPLQVQVSSHCNQIIFHRSLAPYTLVLQGLLSKMISSVISSLSKSIRLTVDVRKTIGGQLLSARNSRTCGQLVTQNWIRRSRRSLKNALNRQQNSKRSEKTSGGSWWEKPKNSSTNRWETSNSLKTQTKKG